LLADGLFDVRVFEPWPSDARRGCGRKSDPQVPFFCVLHASPTEVRRDAVEPVAHSAVPRSKRERADLDSVGA